MCLATGSLEGLVSRRLLDLLVKVEIGYSENDHTQNDISYTRDAFFNNESARRICLNVSMVFGCMPSAFPVKVLPGRSSWRTTPIPKRARLHLEKR